MALILVSYDLLCHEEIMGVVVDGFDSIEEVKDDPFYKRKVFRVQHEEVPTEDIVVCPEIMTLPGIAPFIINFDA